VVRLVVDCDTGIDDALALLFLAQSPQVEIVAVGSVHGNVTAALAAANTQRVFDLVHRSEIPIAVGAARPLAQELQTSGRVHGDDGLGNTNRLPPSRPPVDGSAAEQIVRLARAHPAEFTLLATGPLTNLALALLLEPELPRLIARVVVMGGAIVVPGNATAVAEANVWHDPEAADLVLGAGWDLTLVGLDVTMQTILQGDNLERLQTAAGPIPRFAAEILEHYLDYYQRFLGFRGCALHDPLAAAIALDPSLATYEHLPARVELHGNLTRGQTVVDRRGSRSFYPHSAHAISIAVHVDALKFMNDFLERMEVE